MKIYRTERFKKQYKKLPQYIKKATKKQLGFLLSDSGHPSLNIKKMKDLRIPVMANSDSGGSRTAVRTMANKSRSEATLFFKTSQNFSFKSI